MLVREWKTLPTGIEGDPTKPLTYSTHYRNVDQCLRDVGIKSRAKTHMGRGSSIRMAEAGGVTDLRSQGRWAKGAMEGCYASNLPREAMRVLAGFHRDGKRFHIPRAIVPAPKELREQIFPEVEFYREWLGKNDGSICGDGFIELCDYLRDVLVQDMCVIGDRIGHEIFEQPLRRSAEFKNYKELLLEKMASTGNPVHAQLSVVVPDLMSYLNDAHLSAINETKVGVQLLQEMLDRYMKELKEILSPVETLAKEQKRMKKYIASVGAMGAKMAEKLAAGVEDDDGVEDEAAAKGDGGTGEDLRQFSMSPSVTTVSYLWKEFKSGINGKPSVEAVEEKIGTAWRQVDKKKQWFLRRKKIIKKIEELSGKCGVEQAIDVVERFRGRNTLNWLYKNIRNLNDKKVDELRGADTPAEPTNEVSLQLQPTPKPKRKATQATRSASKSKLPSQHIQAVEAVYENRICGKMKLIPAKGDGNCFYHSLSKSKHIGSDAHEIRQNMQKFMNEKESLSRKLYALVVGDTGDSFEEHRRKQQQNGEWATTFDLFLACVCFGVDLVSSSLKPGYLAKPGGDRPYKWFMTKKKYSVFRDYYEGGCTPPPTVFIVNSHQNHFDYLEPVSWEGDCVPVDLEDDDVFVAKIVKPSTQLGKRRMMDIGTASSSQSSTSAVGARFSSTAKASSMNIMKCLSTKKTPKINTAGNIQKLKTVDCTKITSLNPILDRNIDGAVWGTTQVDKKEYRRKRKEKERMRKEYDNIVSGECDWEALANLPNQGKPKKPRRTSRRL